MKLNTLTWALMTVFPLRHLGQNNRQILKKYNPSKPSPRPNRLHRPPHKAISPKTNSTAPTAAIITLLPKT